MKLPQMTKERMCTALTVAYHLIFSAGATLGVGSYIARLEKIEKTAVDQVDKAEKVSKDAQTTIKGLEDRVKELEKVLDGVKNTCSKVKKPF